MNVERELALRLDDGTVIRDAGWRCVADVAKSYHAFGVRKVYGVIIYVDTGEIHPHHKPDPPASPGPTRLLG